MEAPGITRRRKPFLAPLWMSGLAMALVLVAFVAAGIAWRSATMTTVVVVRHAEKQLGTIEDPPLAPAGEERARRLAQLLGARSNDARLTAIYVSDTRRAQQTAAPLAAALALAPIVRPANDIEGLVEEVLREHRGKQVLIVGHSNTVPAIVGRLAGRDVPPMPDDQYDALYVVSVPSFGPPGLLRLSY
jgi:broad specificity phosphatase PhoE